MESFTFGIITDGKEPAKTARLMASIRAQEIPLYEILIAGEVPTLISEMADLTLPMADAARLGRLGAMRNRIAEKAGGDIIVLLDDDLWLHSGWYAGMLYYGFDFDVLSCVILNPDGSRFWDWKTHKNGYNVNVPYDYRGDDISLTGGLIIARDRVLQQISWDWLRGFYQAEDVDFSNKLRDAGFRIDFNPYSVVTHDAPYFGDGQFVYRT